ncbi:hemerythrin domain-containing protein [Effusibacillus dendaii]|uniref:Hemerythrin-like domain-containing protein n=1 Tax=Effusibacillus dendaii TaxID=2743772 RepID=A0A7I8DB87_9BACL|nr:hemerythrin domain-containing protein [Effusibacillus dendaii]BCJ85181.1 hypothetical protein skT53_01660 [Effusibacillus dendaii]
MFEPSRNEHAGCLSQFGDASAAVSYCAALKQLWEEHSPLRRQMEQMEENANQLREVADAKLGSAFQELVNKEKRFHQELEVHSAKEEDGLFPMMGRYIGTETGPIAVMEYEHSEAKRNLAEFEAAVDRIGNSIGKETVDEVVAPLLKACSILFDHFRKEEHVLFPMAERILTDTEKEELRQIVC